MKTNDLAVIRPLATPKWAMLLKTNAIPEILTNGRGGNGKFPMDRADTHCPTVRLRPLQSHERTPHEPQPWPWFFVNPLIGCGLSIVT